MFHTFMLAEMSVKIGFLIVLFGSAAICYILGKTHGVRLGVALVHEEQKIALKREEKNRKREQLKSTQQNIAGQIKRALNEGRSANYRWGHLLYVSEKPLPVSTITIFKVGSAPNRVVIKFTVQAHFGDLMKVSIATNMPNQQEIWVTDPNSPDLKLLIGNQLDLLRDWSPTPTQVTF